MYSHYHENKLNRNLELFFTLLPTLKSTLTNIKIFTNDTNAKSKVLINLQ